MGGIENYMKKVVAVGVVVVGVVWVGIVVIVAGVGLLETWAAEVALSLFFVA